MFLEYRFCLPIQGVALMSHSLYLDCLVWRRSMVLEKAVSSPLRPSPLLTATTEIEHAYSSLHLSKTSGSGKLTCFDITSTT